MISINVREQEQIAELIFAAEKKSSSELVPMVVHYSDDYPAAHFRSAIIVSFIFSLVLYYSPLSIINPIYFLWIQIPGLLFGYYLGTFPLLKRLLTSKLEKETEVNQRAMQAFFEHGLHLTKNHNGVLIFISLMERQIQIITDHGVKSKIEQKVWDDIVSHFGENVKAHTLVHALKETIEACSHVLENYFPKEASVANGQTEGELKNQLIIE